MGFQRKKRSLGSEEERREGKREGRREGGRERGGGKGEGREKIELFQHVHGKKAVFLFPISCSAKLTALAMRDLIYLFFVSSATELCVLHVIMHKSAVAAGEKFCRVC